MGKGVHRKGDKLKIQSEREEVSPEIINNHNANETGLLLKTAEMKKGQRLKNNPVQLHIACKTST